MRARGVFVCGTDTDVGKTVVSAVLVAGLRAAGAPAGYLKPLASGAVPVPGGPASPDAVFLVRAAGLDEPPQDLAAVCLGPALAPLPAARAEGVVIDPDDLARRVREHLASHPFTVVEGVGGLMVPIAETALLPEFMAALGLPVLVVGRPGLGTINHTLLTIEALRARGMAVLGFVFSGPPPDAPDDPSAADNPALVSQFSGAPYLGRLPWLGPEAAITRVDLETAAGHLDLGPILALTRS